MTQTVNRVIRHFVGLTGEPKFSNKGGMTVIVEHRSGDNVAKVATAVCSVKDAYSRKIGVALATENLEEGRFILVGADRETSRQAMSDYAGFIAGRE